jgi:hypothetical protein
MPSPDIEKEIFPSTSELVMGFLDLNLDPTDEILCSCLPVTFSFTASHYSTLPQRQHIEARLRKKVSAAWKLPRKSGIGWSSMLKDTFSVQEAMGRTYR